MTLIAVDDDLEFVQRDLDNGLDAVAVYGDGLRIRYWNQAMVALSGVERARALRSTLGELFPAMVGSADEAILVSALEGSYGSGHRPFFGARDPAQANDHEWYVLPLLRDGVGGTAVLTARSQLVRGSLREQMAETDQRFVAMADSSPVLLWMAGRDSLCTFFNETWLEFSGRTMDEELGFGWTEGVHPEDFEPCMRTYMEAFNARQPFEMEYRLRRNDGEYRWILDRGVPRTTPSGEFAGHIGSCIDITDRIEAENRTKALADDLARANLYLERLLYATSHDLREPIRSVHNFTELLGRHLEGQLDDTSNDYLARVLDGAVRMRGLVDGMLEFASLRNRPAEHEELDSAELMREICGDLSMAASEAGVQLRVGPLPRLRADRAQLDRAFRNLIENAIKYRSDDGPWVEITAERSGDEWVFCVADNGIGFEQKEADRIFEIFQRLHPRRLYPGFGIGLALVRDIVERHRGRVWVTSVPGQGSRFYAALPAM